MNTIIQDSTKDRDVFISWVLTDLLLVSYPYYIVLRNDVIVKPCGSIYG